MGWEEAHGLLTCTLANNAVNNTELHIKHKQIWNVCTFSVLFSALFAKEAGSHGEADRGLFGAHEGQRHVLRALLAHLLLQPAEMQPWR